MRDRGWWWRGRKLGRRMRALVCSQLYRDVDRDRRHTMFVAGTARSGTTWLADLLVAQTGARMVFEPFHPQKVPEYREYQYFQYMQPEVDDPRLTQFCERLITGRMRNGWIDRQVDRLRPQGRVIKEIRANLLLRWFRDRFPDVPLILMLRHPCAVVASRLQLGWHTDADIASFLQQPELISDHLEPYVSVIEGAVSDEAKHAVIWAVHNLVPLRQFRETPLDIVTYERLCTEPEAEFRRVADLCGVLPASDAIADRALLPSGTTVAHSAVVHGHDRVRAWQEKLSGEQVSRVLDVVRAFDLGHLYDESPMPRGDQGV